jgi:hypothetical protein
MSPVLLGFIGRLFSSAVIEAQSSKVKEADLLPVSQLSSCREAPVVPRIVRQRGTVSAIHIGTGIVLTTFKTAVPYL